MALLEVNGIFKRFGKTEVLKGIDFSMEKGEASPTPTWRFPVSW